jgi:hypothetical protein
LTQSTAAVAVVAVLVRVNVANMKLIMENWKTFLKKEPINEGTSLCAKVRHAMNILTKDAWMAEERETRWAEKYIQREGLAEGMQQDGCKDLIPELNKLIENLSKS